MSVITLLTDFGNSDEYAGVMKGVILSINPGAQVIDITHLIDPQDITQAAYLIYASYKYFPRNTVHVVVIDPGVGTDRKILLLKMDGHYFLAPDNGVLSLLWQEHKMEFAVWVNNSRYFLPEVSRTFHGRDILAPVAAWVSQNIPLKSFGQQVMLSDLTSIPTLPARISSQNIIQGTIISVDHFGNLLTNIEAKTLLKLCQMNPDKLPMVKLGDTLVKGLALNYQNVQEKHGMMIIGSRNYLEIAVNCGNASRRFNLRKNDSLVVSMTNI